MRSKGFTLVELLIVISIIALLSIVAYANFKDLAQEQVINKAIGEIQTVLRLAQTNATSSLLCQDPELEVANRASVDWSARIGTDQVDLICGPNDFPVQITTLQNVSVNSIGGSACPSTSPTYDPPLNITYSKLSGAVKITSSVSCITTSSTVSVNVKNTKTGNSIPFTISSGGAINVE